MTIPTPEQDKALEFALSCKSFKINAFAGTGKTTTLKLIADNINKKGTYLAYNKAIAKESKNKFPSTTNCLTFHSIAFKSTPKHITQKLFNNRWLPNHLADYFNLNSFTIPLAKDPKISAELNGWDQSVILTRAIDNFCSTTDTQINFSHVLYAIPGWADQKYSVDLAYYLLDKARALWNMYIDDHTDIKISHDVYLKYWSLNQPIIPGKYIFVDEAQDADPLMLNILDQQDAQLILVGDSNQAIYGWRGAINAMEKTNLPETSLTQSFRFGPAIADKANLILETLLGVTTPLKGYEAINSKIIICEKPDAYLVRSNSKAIELALALISDNITPTLLVDTSAIETFLDDLDKLVAKQPLSKSSLLFGFNSYNEVIKFVEANEHSDIAPLIKLISKTSTSVIRFVLKQCKLKGGDCIISTAHKSKGLEYNSVSLTDDFIWHPNYELQNIPIMNKDEARLLYVAVTRAINKLDIFSLSDLFDKLKEVKNKR